MVSSTLRDFYQDRSILITGATGFMGKVLVEKLLRSCPQIKTIFLLVRPKYGKDEKTRLQQLLSAKIFDLLKEKHPDATKKLVVVAGDIGLPKLGLSLEDEKLLIDDVSVVFHSAATVKFDEAFRKSVEMNVRGTQRIVDLCRQMRHLEALVHVSTAYSNCDKSKIEEKIYERNITPNQLFEALEWMHQKLIKAVCPYLLAGLPNTYTYTKALAENVLKDEQGVLPVAIVRPAIVGPTWKDPMPGWIDCLNAISGLMVGCGKGIIQTLYCNPNLTVDLVPVDICTNMMIAVAWHTAVCKSNKITVYNCTSGSINPITYGEAYSHFLENALKFPLDNIFWYPVRSFKRNKFYNDICSYLFHFIPAYATDALLYISGKKPFMVNIQKKIQNGMTCLEYIGNREFQFSNDNYWRVWEAMTQEDKCEFNFDFREVHWSSYFEHSCFGGKVHLLKEEQSELPKARRHLKRIYYVRQATRAVGLIMFLYLLTTAYRLFTRSISSFMGP